MADLKRSQVMRDSAGWAAIFFELLGLACLGKNRIERLRDLLTFQAAGIYSVDEESERQCCHSDSNVLERLQIPG